MKKRVFAAVLALTMLLGLMPGTAWAAGDITTISSAEDLKALAVEVNDGNKYSYKTVKLMADIDLGGSEDNQWTPIGTKNNPFSGTFDGGGHKITGLYFNNTEDDQGLFGYVGAGGKVQNLSVSGTVTGGRYVGGVVGTNAGTVTGCCYAGTVTGGTFVGGVVGSNNMPSTIPCTVEKCYNTGAVTATGWGTAQVGGVVGSNDSMLKNCYNTGTVTGTGEGVSVGGVAGRMGDSSYMRYCYNTGKVTGTGESAEVGGMVGYTTRQAEYKPCYFLAGTAENGIGEVFETKQPSDENTTSITADAFKEQTTFADWDFTNIWEMSQALGRPILVNNHEPEPEPEPHTHVWDTDWSADESGHWHKCNAEDCTITNYAECGQTDAAYAAHTAVTDPAVPATCGAAGKTEGSHCSVCQYVITAQTAVPATGNHTYSGYEKNDTQHWQKCTVCQTETAKADHAGGTAACTAKAVCTTCGQSYGELAAHDFTGNYLSDADGHWHKCQNCTATDAKAAHVYDNDQDTKCDTCGYIRTTAPSHTHAWAGDWTAGGTHHWHECTAAGCPIADSTQKDGFAAHTEDSGTVTKPATNTEKGVKTFRCTVCSRVLRTEDIPVLTYSISGVVTEKKDSQQESALGGVELKLMQGNAQVGQTITTGSDGKYSFSNVPAGTYNVVAEQGSGDGKITKTILVVLTDSDATEKNITMPDGKKNSLVEIKGSDTPAAVAGGVDEVAEDQQVEPGQTVTVKLTVEKKAESAVSSDATAIKQVAGGKTVEFLDLSLVKEVMGGSNPGTTNITDTSGRVLEIVLPYDFSGKQNVAVYRYHGGSAQALTRADTGAGGTFKLGADSVIIYATKFSTYAIGYTASGSETPDPTPPTSIPPSGGGSGSPATYSPVIETSGRGKVEVKPRNPEQGDTVTVALAPDKNWQAGGLTVTDRNGKPAAVTDKGGGAYTFIQPNGKVTIQAVFRPDGGYETCLKNSACPIWPYTDAGATAWYHDGVHYCLDRSLMVGLDEHTFAPDADTSRAMVAAILWRLEGSPAVNYVLPFDDVAEGAWYTQAVRWAAASGVVSGYGGGSFGPGDPVTREQLAAILYRYEQYKGGGFSGAWMFPLDFEDAGQVSDWAHEPMCWMTMKGIIGGIGDKLLDPGGRATRAQAAAMLMRFCTKT